MSLQRRDLAGAGGALIVALICVGLGFWQLDRLEQRRVRNAAFAARRALPPIELRGRGLPGDSARGRRIVARGVYDYGHERIRPGRTYEGVPGVALMTPLRLPDGAAVLIDRGWVPSADAYHVEARAYREADTAEVLGLGMPAPRAGGDSLPYALLPFVVQLLPGATVPERPLPSGLIRWPAPALDDGPHLSYAIQWFSFAVIIVVGTGALLRRLKAEH